MVLISNIRKQTCSPSDKIAGRTFWLQTFASLVWGPISTDQTWNWSRTGNWPAPTQTAFAGSLQARLPNPKPWSKCHWHWSLWPGLKNTIWSSVLQSSNTTGCWGTPKPETCWDDVRNVSIPDRNNVFYKPSQQAGNMLLYRVISCLNTPTVTSTYKEARESWKKSSPKLLTCSSHLILDCRLYFWRLSCTQGNFGGLLSTAPTVVTMIVPLASGKPNLHTHMSRSPMARNRTKCTFHRGLAKPHGTATSPIKVFSC